MSKKFELVLERADQPNKTAVGPGIMITPPIEPDYWRYRVKVGEKQAIVGFPKFTTIGVGFQHEDDWNTNLPFSCDADEIYEHIKHNKSDARIPKARCLKAIQMIQDAARTRK